jgi:hypothetical protein
VVSVIFHATNYLKLDRLNFYEAVTTAFVLKMDFYESDSEGADEIIYNVIENLDTLTPSRQSLGLARNYVPDWTSRDAFRDFFQNWQVASARSLHL